MRPRTPTRRCRSISRVSLRPISTGWRLLRNGLANVPSTRRSRRSSNCWSPMVSQRLPVRCAQQGFGSRLTWSPLLPTGIRARTGGPAQRLLLSGHPGEWRNWQTRRIQVPVSERMWGFKSPLAHARSRGPTRTWVLPATRPGARWLWGLVRNEAWRGSGRFRRSGESGSNNRSVPARASTPPSRAAMASG